MLSVYQVCMVYLCLKDSNYMQEHLKQHVTVNFATLPTKTPVKVFVRSDIVCTFDKMQIHRKKLWIFCLRFFNNWGICPWSPRGPTLRGASCVCAAQILCFMCYSYNFIWWSKIFFHCLIWGIWKCVTLIIILYHEVRFFVIIWSEVSENVIEKYLKPLSKEPLYRRRLRNIRNFEDRFSTKL